MQSSLSGEHIISPGGVADEAVETDGGGGGIGGTLDISSMGKGGGVDTGVGLDGGGVELEVEPPVLLEKVGTGVD